MDQAVLELIYRYPGAGLALYSLITLLVSALLSFMIGMERELRGEPAGLSTHILLSVSCTLLTMISIWAIRLAGNPFHFFDGMLDASVDYDPARISAAIVSGVGFLGGGAIVKMGLNVKGLSTAATLWISAALGLACGAGLLVEAVIGTAITMGILFLTGWVKNLIDERLPRLTVAVRGNAPVIARLIELANANTMVIREITSGLTPAQQDGEDRVTEIRMLFAFQTAQVLIMDLGLSILREPNVAYIEYSSQAIGKAERVVRRISRDDAAKLAG